MTAELVRRPKMMDELGLTIGSLAGMVRRCEIEEYKIGKAVYFDRAQVAARLADYRRPAPAPAKTRPVPPLAA